ncbi:MAG: glutamine--tRNA ligase/YqeY domain fusion protein [Acidobacteria bacterium]|nr:glutamine--tRNA ligase/YqeY domain fusion protein [Acidobacteriota bacterium]
MSDHAEPSGSHFIKSIIAEELAAGKRKVVHTRFPPEPNGYLHIGHAKAICLNFGLAEEFGGRCNLRFDDSNPLTERQEYVDSIREDVRWLGFDWEDREFYASDYFEQLHEWALDLIRKGKAYVDDLTADEIREYRGTLTRPGRDSPHRDRSIEENLELFEAMKRGDFPEGSKVLRAKIDMASGNFNMRDPVMYRILHAEHYRRGKEWAIYPTYDFAHGQSDSLEGVTYSLCTLEFEDHRPLYDWFIENLEIFPSRQIEFARLNLSHTVLSKRKLKKLVEEGHVSGWDDPRMPTLSGIRRRGYPPAAVRDFCNRIGVAKADSRVDLALLEHCVRQELNRSAPRRMAVLDPIKVVIENYPEGQSEELEAINNPEDESAGKRKVPFSRELWIERDDFMEDPPKKFFRLGPGREVRLRWAYFITCNEVVKDEVGKIVELHCSYDPETRGGQAPDGRKVRGTIHWVSAEHSIPLEVRLYDHLFTKDDPDQSDRADKGEAGKGEADQGQGGGGFLDNLNHDSVTINTNAQGEPSLAEAAPGQRFQFERRGYFCADSKDHSAGHAVFNRTVTLRDTWAKIQKRS